VIIEVYVGSILGFDNGIAFLCVGRGKEDDAQEEEACPEIIDTEYVPSFCHPWVL
jgi:hypothetical protein